MVGATFDTNILIDYLSGRAQAGAEIESYERRTISVVTWMEVLMGTKTKYEAGTRSFLRKFEILDLDEQVAERAVDLRRRIRRLKLPDAIIWATAQVNSLVLVTRNARDFPANTVGVRVPYVLH